MENLREELTCFICLDYFTNPVTTECGHSFCLMCLLKSWEEYNTTLSCPECWRTLETPHFQPNERLGRLAGIGKQLRSQVLQSEDDQGSYGKMLAATKVFSVEKQGVNAFSTHCHGINRVYVSSEAEEHHRVRLFAQYKSQNTNQFPSLNSHSILSVMGADLLAPDHKQRGSYSILCFRVPAIFLLFVLKSPSRPGALFICHREFVSIAGEAPGNPNSFA